MPFKVLFVTYGDELSAFSTDIPDTQPQTVYDAFVELAGEDIKPSDIYDIFIIEGDLTSVGREYLGGVAPVDEDDEE